MIALEVAADRQPTDPPFSRHVCEGRASGNDRLARRAHDPERDGRGGLRGRQQPAGPSGRQFRHAARHR